MFSYFVVTYSYSVKGPVRSFIRLHFLRFAFPGFILCCLSSFVMRWMSDCGVKGEMILLKVTVLKCLLCEGRSGPIVILQDVLRGS